MSDRDVSERLGALELRLGRLETLLGALNDKLDRSSAGLAESKAGLQAWVTEYVSLRLQQLVPETCEHEPDAEPAHEGPVLPGTRIRCTDEVLHRLGPIPIPFLRRMGTQKVAETAGGGDLPDVDVAFLLRAATL